MKCLPDFNASNAFLHAKQLAITHSVDAQDKWFDGIGSLYDYEKQQFTRKTDDYVVVNEFFKGSYLETVIDEVKALAAEAGVKIGRIRLMLLEPKTCYTLHTDLEEYRFHIPLISNMNCFFVIGETIERMTTKGRVYTLRTKVLHTAVNASNENRLHLVFDTF